MFEKSKFKAGYTLSKTLSERNGPEGSHHLLMQLSQALAEGSVSRKVVMEMIERIFGSPDPILQTELFGREYRSPTGLGPGILKGPYGLDIWSRFPFGFMVLGGISAKPRLGNEGERVWRFDDQGSMVNFFGLPNEGVDSIAAKLAFLKDNRRLPDNLWMNIFSVAENDEDKIREIHYIIGKLFRFTQVFELNFSCPNTHGVTDGIQKSRETLINVIKGAQFANETMAIKLGFRKKPIVVKIGPMRPEEEYEPIANDDLSFEELKMIIETCVECGVDGISIGNTAKNHLGLKNSPGKGGMSGELLHPRALMTLIRTKEILGRTEDDRFAGNLDITLIGAGGVGCGKTIEEAQKSGTAMLKEGAEGQYAVTSFIRNPYSNTAVNDAVADLLKQRKFAA